MTAPIATHPLPRDWPKHLCSAFVCAAALAHRALTVARGWCVDSPIARVRLRGQNDELRSEVALIREELRLKDARMSRVPAAERPHYAPHERLAILQLRAARGWNAVETARRFLLTPKTIADWMARVDEQGPNALVRPRAPVNRFPDFVTALVQQLGALAPLMGRRQLADFLGRAGLCLSAASVARRRRAPWVPPPWLPELQSTKVARGVVARYPGHTWHVDLTLVPTSGF